MTRLQLGPERQAELCSITAWAPYFAVIEGTHPKSITLTLIFQQTHLLKPCDRAQGFPSSSKVTTPSRRISTFPLYHQPTSSSSRGVCAFACLSSQPASACSFPCAQRAVWVVLCYGSHGGLRWVEPYSHKDVGVLTPETSGLFRGNQVKRRSFVRNLIQWDWHPYKRGNLAT